MKKNILGARWKINISLINYCLGQTKSNSVLIRKDEYCP